MDLLERILDFIFPPVCGFCNEINKNFLCDECKSKFNEIKISSIENYSNVPVFFEEHYYTFKYENEIRELLLEYKFNEKSYLYKTFAEFILEDTIFIENFIKKYDVITSVPIHRKRMRSRGYNQSKLIAKEVAKKLGIEYIDKAIVKSKNITAQSTLDMLGRIKNINGAFCVGEDLEKIKGKKVAIFDDIFTTGATVNECAKVLKEAGAESVSVFTLAS